MAATKAQQNRPKSVYGKQVKRGNMGEIKAASMLSRAGYTVTYSDKHPHGKADLKATKGKITRYIQVKNITSRSLKTEKAARHRIAGEPFGLKRIPAGLEVWVFDKDNRLYKFKNKSS